MKEKAIKRWKIKAAEPKEHWAADYFKKNPLRSVTAGLTTFGLTAIFAYHFHIEYAPNFDIKSLASTIFLAAFVGLCFFAACSVCIFYPVYFIGTYALSGEQAEAKIDHRIISAFILSGLAFLAFFSLIVVAAEFDVGPQAALLLPLAFTLSYLLLKKVFSKVQTLFHAAYLQHKPARWRDWSFSAAKALIGQATSIWYRENTDALKLAAFMVLIFILQMLPIQIYFIVMRDAPSLNESKIDWWRLYQQLFMICVTLQAGGLYLVKAWHRSRLPQRHKLYSVVVILLAPFMITFLGGNPAFFPCSLAYTLKIGNFAATEITLTATGCDVVASKGATVCEQNKIYGAYVMSRIGTEIYLKMRSPDGKSPVSVYIPAKDVSGMKVDETKRFFNKQSIEKFLSGGKSA